MPSDFTTSTMKSELVRGVVRRAISAGSFASATSEGGGGVPRPDAAGAGEAWLCASAVPASETAAPPTATVLRKLRRSMGGSLGDFGMGQPPGRAPARGRPGLAGVFGGGRAL